MSLEPVTDRDREIMRKACGVIVRHIPSGFIGHAWPSDPIPDDYLVLEDYRKSFTAVVAPPVGELPETPGQLELFEATA